MVRLWVERAWESWPVEESGLGWGNAGGQEVEEAREPRPVERCGFEWVNDRGRPVEGIWEIRPLGKQAAAGMVSTLTSEERFVAAMVSGREMEDRLQTAGLAHRLVQHPITALAAGGQVDAVVADVLAALPAGEHVAISLLRIASDGRAELAEIDAPPIFMARKGDFVLLPVVEEEAGGRLIRRCDFTVQAGDHLALISEGAIPAGGGVRSWSWRDVAFSVRRLTATGCDAEQLAGALVRLAKQRSGEFAMRHFPCAILALFVRPLRTATVWSGPPADRRRDQEVLRRLLAEEGTRIICGDTTARLVARLLDATLILEPRPADGWREVPPASRLVMPNGIEPVTLITEGVVTLRAVADRLAAVRRPAELAGRSDGASRLAKLLLEADRITFLVGLAVNPAQTEWDGTPLRKSAVAAVAEALRARGKLVAMEYV